MSFALMMLGGMVLDLVFGWPGRLFMLIGHPVTWLGRTISALERRFNSGSFHRRLAGGALTVLLIILASTGVALALQTALPNGWAGVLIGSVLAWPMIALRSMHAHVSAVARPLSAADLPAARNAVSMIVGRDPAQMDSAAVARAATESLAENTSDGVVAPLFWGALLGLPGLYAYKAINTMDSMIGHRTERYEAFGKIAAHLDDIVNWLPARLTGIAYASVSVRPLHALRVMVRDAPRHRSFNAGWPEAAMAAALGIRLSGPRTYEHQVSQEPWLNEAAPDPQTRDLHRALSLYRYVMTLCGLALGALALF
ncbi:cobalamin biosynthesis protein CobD [Rhodobacteraceae bacterium 63075]|nr:cobalamin biosynthesis protein CobD [Rhodobacteraceae bacterium 63075]